MYHKMPRRKHGLNGLNLSGRTRDAEESFLLIQDLINLYLLLTMIITD